MRKLIFYGIFFTLAGGLVFTGCKKEKEKEPTPSTQSITDNDLATSEFDDVFSTSDDVMTQNDGSLSRLSSAVDTIVVYDTTRCAQITIIRNPGTSPPTGTITVDFGATNTTCTGTHGKTRRGKIIITFTNRLRVVGGRIDVCTDNYYVNDIHIEGCRTVIHVNDTVFTHTLADTVGGTGYAKITLADGTTTISKKGERTRTWISGSDTQKWIWDDIYEITGESEGINRNGVSFQVTITKALRKELKCLIYPTPRANRSFLPVSGTIEIIPGSSSTRVVDFGSGTCDKDFTVTVDGNTFNCIAGQGCSK